MTSQTTERFRKSLAALPDHIQQRARQVYASFQQNPNHPGLQFKQVHSTRPIYSVRISLDYRALGVLDDDEMIWFWIGSHADYDRLLAGIR